MNKKAVIIKFNEQPIFISDLVTFEDTESYKKMKEACEKNLKQLVSSTELEYKNFKSATEHHIKSLEIQLELFNAEIDLLRGRITEEEYTKRVMSYEKEGD